jgi:hypothetical protein
MNLLSKRTLSVATVTAALTVVAMAQSGAAQAFLITRTAGPLPAAGINAPLAPPTVIDFDSLNGIVPTTPTTLVPGGPNGGATIARTPGTVAGYLLTDGLRIGALASGEVSFKFDDPRGMGYFGFFLDSITAPLSAVSISFLSGNSLIQSLTGTQLNQVTGPGNYFNFFVTNNSEIFDQVLLTDSSGGLLGGNFVVDNVAYQAIPTPALLPGLVALGIGVVRKRKAEAEAEAEA